MYKASKLEKYDVATLSHEVEELKHQLSKELGDALVEAFGAKLGEYGARNKAKDIRDRWLGRKQGLLTGINELWLKEAPLDAKKIVGQAVNEVRVHVTERVNDVVDVLDGIPKYSQGDLDKIRGHLEELLEKARIKEALDSIVKASSRGADAVDITLPGIRRPLGAEHPVVRTMNHIVGVFKAMGYSIGEGPEIETDYYNFESLGFPPNHPARDTQDTIFISGQEQKQQRDRLLLRTHTSPVQVRTMEKQKPPVRIVIPGKVHRNDAADASHSPIFHQVEGLAVDKHITFSDLKGTLDHAMKAFFGSKVKTRFFPSFFPFTEPSADVQISCFKCGGSGQLNASTACRVCKTSGWIELVGCGMVDPRVFEFVKHNGYDASEISGFAFGMGVERIAMAMYDIDDIQLFYQGDVRFLEQFA